jgi:hypothetical protein
MRKTSTVAISAPGRDTGKTFLLTEMSAAKAEKWGQRALGVMIRGGVDLPDLLAASGFSGIVSVGFMALFAAPWGDVEPLLDELMTCVQAVPDQNKPVPRGLFEGDIEEVSTLVKLRLEAFELSSGFSVAGALSDLKSKMAAAQDGDTPSTPTSQDE